MATFSFDKDCDDLRRWKKSFIFETLTLSSVARNASLTLSVDSGHAAES